MYVVYLFLCPTIFSAILYLLKDLKQCYTWYDMTCLLLTSRRASRFCWVGRWILIKITTKSKLGLLLRKFSLKLTKIFIILGIKYINTTSVCPKNCVTCCWLLGAWIFWTLTATGLMDYYILRSCFCKCWTLFIDVIFFTTIKKIRS